MKAKEYIGKKLYILRWDRFTFTYQMEEVGTLSRIGRKYYYCLNKFNQETKLELSTLSDEYSMIFRVVSAYDCEHYYPYEGAIKKLREYQMNQALPQPLHKYGNTVEVLEKYLEECALVLEGTKAKIAKDLKTWEEKGKP